jgi:glycosyltransferase involved in cell wall biosynthesis
MRIAFHVPRASFLGAGYSGDQVLVAGLIDGLRQLGHDVQIVSRIDARDVGRGRVPLHRMVREMLRVRRRIGDFAPDAWLVYGPSVTEPDLFGWWQRPMRYVLFAAYYGHPERLAAPWRTLFTAAHRRSILNAEAVAVFRPRTAARIRDLGIGDERVVILPPAVAVPTSVTPKQEARRALGLPSDDPIVLCVSRFSVRRRDGRPGKVAMLRELLRAIAALPPPVLCAIVGDGPGRSEIEGESARLGLHERVRFAGRVPDVLAYFAACDVFAYPYELDRPWLALLEAQASGRPVVTMRTGSAQLIVDDGRTGLLAGDIEEFRTHLAALVADQVRCDEMGQAAREYASRVHSMDVRVREILALLSGQPYRAA